MVEIEGEELGGMFVICVGISIIGTTMLGRHKTPNVCVSWLLYQSAHSR
jgi:hypothetical protein